MSTIRNFADELLMKRDFRAALQAYLNLIQKNPSDGKAYAGVAQSCFGLKDFNAAATASQKAIELDESLAAPHLILAAIHLHRQDFNKALTEARRAYELSPESEEAANLYGVLLMSRGELDESILVLRQTLELHPKSGMTHRNLAVAYREKRDFKKYVEEVKLMFKHEPSVFSAYQLVVSYQQRYALFLSVIMLTALSVALLVRLRALLIVPTILVVQGLFADLEFIREGRWRGKGKWKILLFSLITDIAFAVLTYASYVTLIPK